jgi:DNA mismatch repair protein MutS2
MVFNDFQPLSSILEFSSQSLEDKFLVKFFPIDLSHRLEMDKVLELATKECYGEPGQFLISQLQPINLLPEIEIRLKEVREVKLGLEHADRLPLSNYETVLNELKLLHIEDYVLSQETLVRLRKQLALVKSIFEYFIEVRREVYPTLWKRISENEWKEDPFKELQRVIDEDGNVRADASPVLQKIRKSIGSKQRELDNVFRRILVDMRQKGMLAETEETLRNGRRVLAIPAEQKRQIRGIIHDESATGKTSYIEPEEVIAINNDLFDLEQDEKREIYKIFKELCAFIRPYGEDFHDYELLLAHLDSVYARARVAMDMNGNMPILVGKPSISWYKAVHPLLFLKNKIQDRPTIPFDLHFDKPNRILVLSGPNAGGKSIAMKAVGLIQWMVQTGFLVPVSEISEVGVFRKIFADIGDQQSMEDDLSTYSSHLKNMRHFIENADQGTLLLMDEFGAGTDPRIGGAIAEAILSRLNEQKSHGIITTHYTNLKLFAFKTKGLLNASMTFDKETLSPRYELKVGKPGSSYAFEIATKSGIPEEVIEHSRKKIGKKEESVETLLIELQRDKKDLEDKISENDEKAKMLDNLIKNYEYLQKDLDFRQKKFQLDQKESLLSQSTSLNKELESVLKELRASASEEIAKKKIASIKLEQVKLAEEVKIVREELIKMPLPDGMTDLKPLKKGDYVQLRTGGYTGKIESVSNDKAEVTMGDLRLTIRLIDLIKVKPPAESKDKKSALSVPKTVLFSNKLDIRGLTKEEANLRFEQFMDQSLMQNVQELHIVHGKGTGVLRQLVRDKLKEYRDVKTVRHPAPELGGDGVSIIEF